MDKGQTLTVAERIRAKFEELTRAERQLANAMLENYPVSALGSITAVAETSEVSPPTVARMARKLGFNGFPELQSALKSELEAKISNPITKHERWAQNAPDAHILNRCANAVFSNMQQTLQQMDLTTFNEVARLLCNNEHAIHVVGGRITRTLADYFFTHLQMIRNDVSLISENSSTWPPYVLNMQPGDILVAFDIRRYERDIMRLAEMATAKGVKLILFTDQWGSPVEQVAIHIFRTHIEAPSAWDSSVVNLFIIEALIAAVQEDSWGETETRMHKLEALFDEMSLFRKFT